MQTITIDGSDMTVDFGGLISPREEQIFAYSCQGKSQSTIAMILGTQVDTVNKQTKSLYRKNGVDGLDRPMSALQAKAFLNKWARFAIVIAAVMTYSSNTTQSNQMMNRTNLARISQQARRNELT